MFIHSKVRSYQPVVEQVRIEAPCDACKEFSWFSSKMPSYIIGRSFLPTQVNPSFAFFMSATH